jgi:hypothetical protein
MRCSVLCVALLAAAVAAAAVDRRVTPFFSIGLVADNHYDTFPAGEKAPWQPMDHWYREQAKRTTTTTKRRYDLAKDKMLETADVFNRVGGAMAFAVNLGDLINNDVMWNLRPILDAFNTIAAPHFSIVGNHDLRAHNDRFGKNNKTQQEWVKKKLGLVKDWFYSFSYPPFHFVFIDSMVMEETADPRRRQQMAWLEGDLQRAADAGLVVILFGHVPLGLATNALGPIIKKHAHVVGGFFGHFHKGGYVKQDHFHTVTLNGQIDTLQNAFSVLELFDDRMELTGFGRCFTKILPFTNAATVRLLRKFAGAPGRDLRGVPGQPLPAAELWKDPATGRDEALQALPPLMLKIPGYRKPLLAVSEPSGGANTRFVAEVYRKWPRRVLTRAPEEATDLSSASGGKTWYNGERPGPANRQPAAARPDNAPHPPAQHSGDKAASSATPRRDARPTAVPVAAALADDAQLLSLYSFWPPLAVLGVVAVVALRRRTGKRRGAAARSGAGQAA